MVDKFTLAINYLEELKADIKKENQDPQELLITIIKYAILNDKYREGSILLTKTKDFYQISTIQKHSYVWNLVGLPIDLNKLLSELERLNISYHLDPYKISDHEHDFELSFNMNSKKKTRVSN